MFFDKIIHGTQYYRAPSPLAEEWEGDIARMEDADEFAASGENARTAVLYTLAYLYEHREEADHHALTLTLRALLFGMRKEAF